MISAVVLTVKRTYIPLVTQKFTMVDVYVEHLANHRAVKIAGVGACMEWALAQGNRYIECHHTYMETQVVVKTLILLKQMSSLTRPKSIFTCLIRHKFDEVSMD